mmetsp:Transcript_3002/g.6957  ORF Transcript_3002/g.6957 Transcript_3002/m.6957 type:complete len:118 (-) Transcript_3002:3153-3506(-)
MLAALRVMYQQGVAGKTFYMGDEGDIGHNYKYGLVNLAAFLAQSMKETVKYDVCDENSWDLVGGRYPLSNAWYVSSIMRVTERPLTNTHTRKYAVGSLARVTRITTAQKQKNIWSVK